MDYKNFSLDADVNIKSLKILINQCWKTLPIYEGKNKESKIIYSRDVAYSNYQKHLSFLITKISGASKLWQNNQYYVELAYILNGMTSFGDDEHDRVRYIVHHCIKLINDMIEVVSNES